MMNAHRANGELVVTTTILPIEHNFHTLSIQSRITQQTVIKFHANGEPNAMIWTLCTEQIFFILKRDLHHALLMGSPNQRFVNLFFNPE
jgi:hypothetical protein